MKAVIVGSGLAGVTIAESLAKGAPHDITLVTAETHGYYSRPRLSHGMALSDDAAAKIVLKPFDALAGVKVRAGEQAWLIDRERRRLVLEDGEALAYETLVLATGSAARIPPALLRSEAPRWAVVGGGLIGCEVASDLHRAGDSVTIFHRESRLIELQLTESQPQALHEHFSALGIEVRYRQDLNELPRGFDGVIVATGFAPRVDLARDAGLATARGIVVDEYLRTADPGIYAAGDVAEIGGRLYPFVSPIRSQALWLADHLEGRAAAPWQPPAFSPVIKIHGFRLDQAVKSRLLV